MWRPGVSSISIKCSSSGIESSSGNSKKPIKACKSCGLKGIQMLLKYMVNRHNSTKNSLNSLLVLQNFTTAWKSGNIL